MTPSIVLEPNQDHVPSAVDEDVIRFGANPPPLCHPYLPRWHIVSQWTSLANISGFVVGKDLGNFSYPLLWWLNPAATLATAAGATPGVAAACQTRGGFLLVNRCCLEDPMAGIWIIGNMDISSVEQSNVCALAKWQHGPRRVKREQAGSFCETLASYPNDLCFNMFTLRQLFICTVLRDVARSCTYHFTTKFGDPWLLAQHIPTSSTSLSLLSLLLLLLPPLVLLLLLSWACCKGAAAPAHWNERDDLTRALVIWYNSRIQNMDHTEAFLFNHFPSNLCCCDPTPGCIGIPPGLFTGRVMRICLKHLESQINQISLTNLVLWVYVYTCTVFISYFMEPFTLMIWMSMTHHWSLLRWCSPLIFSGQELWKYSAAQKKHIDSLDGNKPSVEKDGSLLAWQEPLDVA